MSLLLLLPSSSGDDATDVAQRGYPLRQTNRRRSSPGRGSLDAANGAVEGEAGRLLLRGVLEKQFDGGTAATFLHTAALALTNCPIATRTFPDSHDSVAVGGQLLRLEHHRRLQVQAEPRRQRQRLGPQAHRVVRERERRQREQQQRASRTGQTGAETGEPQCRKESVSISNFCYYRWK